MESVPGGGGGGGGACSDLQQLNGCSSTLSFTCLRQMSAALILFKQVSRGGANALPLRLHFPPAVAAESFHRACGGRTGPDRVAVCVMCFGSSSSEIGAPLRSWLVPGSGAFRRRWSSWVWLSWRQVRLEGTGGKGATTGVCGRKQQAMEAGVGLPEFHTVLFFTFNFLVVERGERLLRKS